MVSSSFTANQKQIDILTEMVSSSLTANRKQLDNLTEMVMMDLSKILTAIESNPPVHAETGLPSIGHQRGGTLVFDKELNKAVAIPATSDHTAGPLDLPAAETPAAATSPVLKVSDLTSDDDTPASLGAGADMPMAEATEGLTPDPAVDRELTTDLAIHNDITADLSDDDELSPDLADSEFTLTPQMMMSSPPMTARSPPTPQLTVSPALASQLPMSYLWTPCCPTTVQSLPSPQQMARHPIVRLHPAASLHKVPMHRSKPQLVALDLSSWHPPVPPGSSQTFILAATSTCRWRHSSSACASPSRAV